MMEEELATEQEERKVMEEVRYEEEGAIGGISDCGVASDWAWFGISSNGRLHTRVDSCVSSDF